MVALLHRKNLTTGLYLSPTDVQLICSFLTQKHVILFIQDKNELKCFYYSKTNSIETKLYSHILNYGTAALSEQVNPGDSFDPALNLTLILIRYTLPCWFMNTAFKAYS